MELILDEIIVGICISLILFVNIFNVNWYNKIISDDMAKPREVILVYLSGIIYLIASITGLMIALYLMIPH